MIAEHIAAQFTTVAGGFLAAACLEWALAERQAELRTDKIAAKLGTWTVGLFLTGHRRVAALTIDVRGRCGVSRVGAAIVPGFAAANSEQSEYRD